MFTLWTDNNVFPMQPNGYCGNELNHDAMKNPGELWMPQPDGSAVFWT